MSQSPEKNQVPRMGPLSSLKEDDDFYGEVQYLEYGGRRHLRKAFRIPIDALHFNIENGRYATKYTTLQNAHAGVNIEPRQTHWRNEILKMLNGTWEDPATGINTRSERSHFLGLVEDLGRRGQERTGIVLEDGGVMSGNRRLAALITLSKKQPDVAIHRYFHAFIVPGQGVSRADRWRLEMSAQMGQNRLLRDYDSVERLIKIREGVQLLRETNVNDSEAAAIETVANDFGTDEATIRSELDTIKHIDNYLLAIGQPGQYQLANALTEVFTEFEPLERAMEVNALHRNKRQQLRTGIFYMILNDQADYKLIRDIRTAVGPAIRRKDAVTIPKAVEAITANAPDLDVLEKEPTTATRTDAESMAERFRAEFQAGKSDSLQTKAHRGEVSLRAVKEALERGSISTTDTSDKLRETLSSARNHADEAIQLL